MVAITVLHPSLLSLYPCITTSTGSTRLTPLSTNFGNFSGFRNSQLRQRSHICCSTANKPSAEISSAAKIRSEVLTPFRTVRMFFYIAFIASGGLGTLISLTQLIPCLINPSKSQYTSSILQSFLIDICAVLLFTFLYSRENKAKNLQLARLSREEGLSKLKLRINKNKVISMSELRGLARLVIIAGPSKFILESFERSKEFTNGLVERGVLVVPFCTDGAIPEFTFGTNEDESGDDEKRKRLWQLTPVITSSWAEWIDEQKKLANVAPDSPVYLSLRMDGRVRGSGVGYAPWNAFVAQLPPIKGIWTGLLDGMDGKVL